MGTATVTAITTAIADAAGDVTGLVTTNLPVILGVTVAFLGLRVAKRFVKSLAS